jgi:prepilin-type N-terminal cleavage/methylation domain-containing protein
MTSATGESGFTLLELLVVLTIIALIASAWPLLESNFFAAQRLRDATQTVIADIRIAQMEARMSGIPQHIQIPTGGTFYSIGTDTHVLPSGLIMRLHTEPGHVASRLVTVFPDGSADGDGIELFLSGRKVSISVLPMTGRVEIAP